jgi:hypothetical protein
MAPRIARLTAFLGAVMSISACDPFVVRQLEISQTARPNTATVTLSASSSELVALVDEVAQRHGFSRTSNDRRFVLSAIYVYEGTYEVCGVLACTPKRVTIEIAEGNTPSDSIISVVDWFSFSQSDRARTVEGDLTAAVKRRFGDGVLKSVQILDQPNNTVERDARKSGARPSP